MAQLCINIPEELKNEIQQFGNPSLLIRSLLKKELQEKARLKSIVSKSKLTEQDVEELSDKIDKSLSEKFEQSLKE